MTHKTVSTMIWYFEGTMLRIYNFSKSHFHLRNSKDWNFVATSDEIMTRNIKKVLMSKFTQE